MGRSRGCQRRSIFPSVIASHVIFFFFSLCLVITVCAESSQIRSSKGVSMLLPEGWRSASKDQTAALVGEVGRMIKTNIDLDKVDILLFNPVSKGPVESINIVVSSDRIPIADSDAENQYSRVLGEMFAEAGWNISSLEARKVNFGKHSVLLADCTLSLQGRDRVRQWQVLFVGAKWSYIVTCSAGQENFTKLEPTFREVLSSIDFDDYRPVVAVSGGTSSSDDMPK